MPRSPQSGAVGMKRVPSLSSGPRWSRCWYQVKRLETKIEYGASDKNIHGSGAAHSVTLSVIQALGLARIGPNSPPVLLAPF